MVNIDIQLNLLRCCSENNIKFFINLGSSCIYPKLSRQPIKEDYLLDGKLEVTNEGYALAKIIGLKACEYHNLNPNIYFTLMPCNLYGPNDEFDLNKSHFLPALIKNFINLKKIIELKFGDLEMLEEKLCTLKIYLMLYFFNGKYLYKKRNFITL